MPGRARSSMAFSRNHWMESASALVGSQLMSPTSARSRSMRLLRTSLPECLGNGEEWVVHQRASHCGRANLSACVFPVGQLCRRHAHRLQPRRSERHFSRPNDRCGQAWRNNYPVGNRLWPNDAPRSRGHGCSGGNRLHHDKSGNGERRRDARDCVRRGFDRRRRGVVSDCDTDSCRSCGRRLSGCSDRCWGRISP